MTRNVIDGVQYGVVTFSRYLTASRRIRQLLGIPRDELQLAFRRLRNTGIYGKDANPFMNSDFYKAAVLYSIITHFRPNVVVETGVAEGNSTAGILLGMHDAGTGFLYSIDLPNGQYETDKGDIWEDKVPDGRTGWKVPQGLRKYWKLYIGKSEEVLPQVLKDLGTVDIFYHDSEHTYKTMRFELESVWPYLSKGGIICCDNTNWSNAFQSFAEENKLANKIIFPFFGLAKSP